NLPFTDNFTITGDGSQLTTNWSDQLGNVTVVNGQATGEGAFNLSTVNGLNIGNAKVTANVSVNPGGNVGLVARYTGPLYNDFYLGQLRDLGNGQFQAAIFKNIGGVFTTIPVRRTTAATGAATAGLRRGGLAAETNLQQHAACLRLRHVLERGRGWIGGHAAGPGRDGK